MNVTITGPNAHGGMFHVHATGCADLARGVYRTVSRFERHEEYHASVQSVVEAVYSDIIAENEGDLAAWDSYLSEFRFFPCTDGLPLKEAPPAVQLSASNALCSCPGCETAQRRMGK